MFNRANFWALALVSLSSLTLSACNQSSTSTAMPSVDNRPTYIALTDPIYAPFEFKNPDGTVGGMEIEIFNAIAEDQGFKVKYIPHAWEGIYDHMRIHDRHFVVSAVTATPEAKQKATLSDPYFSSPYRVVSLDKTKLANWRSQPRVAVSENEDIFKDLPKMGVNPAQLVHYDTIFLALNAVAHDEADVVVGDKTVLTYYMTSEALKQMNDKFVAQDLPYDETSDIRFAVQKGNTELLNKVNTGIEHLKSSGKLAQIVKKYHQDPAAIIYIKPQRLTASQTAKP